MEKEIDFVLKPFNRTNTYQIQLLVNWRVNSKVSGYCTLSSPQPVKFEEIKTIVFP